MADERVQMPSSQGGLVRYFDDVKSSIQLKPSHVVVLAALVLIVEIILRLAVK